MSPRKRSALLLSLQVVDTLNVQNNFVSAGGDSSDCPAISIRLECRRRPDPVDCGLPWTLGRGNALVPGGEGGSLTLSAVKCPSSHVPPTCDFFSQPRCLLDRSFPLNQRSRFPNTDLRQSRRRCTLHGLPTPPYAPDEAETSHGTRTEGLGVKMAAVGRGGKAKIRPPRRVSLICMLYVSFACKRTLRHTSRLPACNLKD